MYYNIMSCLCGLDMHELAASMRGLCFSRLYLWCLLPELPPLSKSSKMSRNVKKLNSGNNIKVIGEFIMSIVKRSRTWTVLNLILIPLVIWVFAKDIFSYAMWIAQTGSWFYIPSLRRILFSFAAAIMLTVPFISDMYPRLRQHLIPAFCLALTAQIIWIGVELFNVFYINN